MRKSALEIAILKYDRSLSDYHPSDSVITSVKKLFNFFPSEDYRVTLLKEFLNSNEIAFRLNQEEILFSEFLDFIQRTKNLKVADVFSEEFLKSNTEAAKLFNLFSKHDGNKLSKLINPSKNKDSKSFDYSRLPDVVRMSVVAKFYDINTRKNLAATSRFFEEEMRKTNNLFWLDKLRLTSCNKNSLEKVIRANVIRYYERLYIAICKLPFAQLEVTSAWEICCLSGEPNAIKYAIEQEGLTKQTLNQFGHSPIHLAGLSGSVPAIKFCIHVLEIDPNTPFRGATLFHYITQSGSLKAIEFGHKKLKFNPIAKFTDAKSYLFSVAMSGSLSAIRYFLNDFNFKNAKHEVLIRSLLNPTVMGNSVQCVKFCVEELKLPPSKDILAWIGNSYPLQASVEILEYFLAFFKMGIGDLSKYRHIKGFGEHFLHSVAVKGNTSFLRYCINELKLDPTVRDNFKSPLLHYAIRSGSIETIEYTLNDLKQDPADVSTNGKNLFHFAAASLSIETVLFVRRLVSERKLNLDPNARDSRGMNAFDIAKASKFMESFEKAMKADLSVAVIPQKK